MTKEDYVVRRCFVANFFDEYCFAVAKGQER